MSEERTERATPKRRQEARRRGEVPRSTELTSAVGLLASIALLRWYTGQAAGSLAGTMRGTFSLIRQPDISPLRLQQLGWEAGLTFVRVAGPLLGLALVVGIAINVAQSGLVFSFGAIKPNFGRINPAQGIKRIVSKRGAFETVKALIKLVLIGGLTYPVLMSEIERFAGLTGSDPLTIGRAIGNALTRVGFRAGAAFLVLALIDYGYQRWDYERRMRMTRQELREELRQSEGNPELKSRIRRLQRQLSRGRMMAAVPAATVIVTNPTHLAIAIRYEMSTMPAPIVIAKGSGHVAERIKQVAREHAIPVIENKPLAQSLFRVADIGAEIPMGLYEAVADVIAYVYRLRTRSR